MAVTTYWYAKAFIATFNKEVDYQSGAKINDVLCSSSYTPNQDTHDFFNDVTNQLSTANGYTAEDGSDTGHPVVSPAITTTNNVANLDSSDPQWTFTGAGNTARIYVQTDVTAGSAASDPLLWWSDFGQNETASGGGTFTYVVNASGWATITATDATGFP